MFALFVTACSDTGVAYTGDHPVAINSLLGVRVYGRAHGTQPDIKLLENYNFESNSFYSYEVGIPVNSHTLMI